MQQQIRMQNFLNPVFASLCLLGHVSLAGLSLSEGFTHPRVGSHRFFFADSSLETFVVISEMIKQTIGNLTSSS